MHSFNCGTKKSFDRAGHYLAGNHRNKFALSAENDDAAFQALYDWRIRHKIPQSDIRTQLLRTERSLRFRSKRIIATRLKRATSIVNKLRREAGMELTQMQDVCGARIVLRNMEELTFFQRKFAIDAESRQSRFIIKSTKNYINNPKCDGYKSIHIVCGYRPTYVKERKGLLVEVQMRTRYQHIWATAVEAMGLYTGEQLKNGAGDPNNIYFFKLCSAAISIIEGTEVPEEFKNMSHQEIRDKIRILEGETNVLTLLNQFSMLDNYVENKLAKEDLGKGVGYFLFIFNRAELKLRVRPFLKRDFKSANKIYNSYEEQVRKGAPLDVVLITASDRKKLKKAYPNYFADTRQFCFLIRKFGFAD